MLRKGKLVPEDKLSGRMCMGRMPLFMDKFQHLWFFFFFFIFKDIKIDENYLTILRSFELPHNPEIFFKSSLYFHCHDLSGVKFSCAVLLLTRENLRGRTLPVLIFKLMSAHSCHSNPDCSVSPQKVHVVQFFESGYVHQ